MVGGKEEEASAGGAVIVKVDEMVDFEGSSGAVAEVSVIVMLDEVVWASGSASLSLDSTVGTTAAADDTCFVSWTVMVDMLPWLSILLRFSFLVGSGLTRASARAYA